MRNTTRTVRPAGVRHSGPSEALLRSHNVAGSEPASVICTLAAVCRPFVLWSERHCAGRMIVRTAWKVRAVRHPSRHKIWLAGRHGRCTTQDCVIEKTLKILVSNAYMCSLLVYFCCIIGPTGSIMNKH